MNATLPTIRTLGANKSYRPVLVGLASASLVLGLPPWQVLDLVDDGGLAWVWDLSVHRRRRDLRFLLQELEGQSVADGIGLVIGPPDRQVLPACRVAEALGISLDLVAKLGRHNLLAVSQIGPRRAVVDRASLVGLLRSRLVGGEPPTPARPVRPGLHLPAPAASY